MAVHQGHHLNRSGSHVKFKYRPPRAAPRGTAALLCLGVACVHQGAQAQSNPRTPIQHVIVVVGENRTFDNLYGVYQPQRGQTVSNLLSRGIVNAQGLPGPNFALARQATAQQSGAYSPTPPRDGSYAKLPAPHALGAAGQGSHGPDARIAGPLPNGPYQITRHVSYGAHTGDPVHRFFQMWQQLDGGANDLFVWTSETAAAGPSTGPSREPPQGSFQGGIAMGYYNMAQGDAPYFKHLADHYALADNYHQSVMGGTTANYFSLATADMASYNEAGKLAVPPAKRIENPDTRPGANNWWVEDGYDGGTYVNCADATQPGVAGIRRFLASLPYRAFNDGNCEPGAYYMVNNLDPGYSATGKALEIKPNSFLVPPQTMPHIGDALSAAGVSWKWYSGGRNHGDDANGEYCKTCDALTQFRSTMTGPDLEKLQDLSQFYVDVRGQAAGFPAFSVIAPYDSVSGHPGYSLQPSFEFLVKDVVEHVQRNPALWKNTVVLVTFDEGGGYYDSGYSQFIDFFGDGTRVPMVAVSPFARRGHVDHTYYDHASILKFVERNWGLAPLSSRSRDNLPNPVHSAQQPYVPLNRPAVGDLMNLFDFSKGKTP
jgi:acid phosphatase